MRQEFILELIDKIKAAGLPCMGFVASDEPEDEDDAVNLTTEVHVQLGYDYMIANRTVLEPKFVMYSGKDHFMCLASIPHLIAELRKFIADSQP